MPDKKKVEEEKEKKVSKKNRTIVYIESSEEVTNVFEKVENAKEKDVYVVVPNGASIFSSIINLKILLKKSQEIGKNIYIVTTDTLGENLCESAGIETLRRIEDEKLKFKYVSLKNKKPIPKEEKKKDSPKKISIAEVVGSLKQEEEKETKPKKKKKAKKRQKNPYLLLKSPNRIWLLFFFLGSMFLFALIIYIAFPSAIIKVSPESNRIYYSNNFVIADYQKNAFLFRDDDTSKLVPATKLTVEFEKILKFPATGGRNEITSAKGTIRIYNNSTKEKYFIPSRFKAENGVIFRTQEAITVPAAQELVDENGNTKLVPGFIDKEVLADELDENGQQVGVRGNIGPSKFTMPAIPTLSPSIFWAENFKPFSGGGTVTKKYVSADDLKSAEINMKEKMFDIAMDELEKKNQERNAKEGKNSAILKDDYNISKELVEVRVPTWLEGKVAEEFEVYAKVRITGVIFHQDQIIETCKKNIRNNVHPDKKLAFVDENSFSYQVIERNMEAERYKITARIEGREEYDLSLDKESGLKLVKKIKDAAMGKTVDEAETLINNFPEISKVKITNEPFWAFAIPTLPENIEIVLLDN